MRVVAVVGREGVVVVTKKRTDDNRRVQVQLGTRALVAISGQTVAARQSPMQ